MDESCLCLVCCDYFIPRNFKDANQGMVANRDFKKFCKELDCVLQQKKQTNKYAGKIWKLREKFVKNGNMNLDYGKVSICSDCFHHISGTSDVSDAIKKVEETVQGLQKKVLTGLKELKPLVKKFLDNKKTIAQIIQKSNEPLLHKFINAELSSRQIEDIINFRQKILTNLPNFQQQLEDKTQCDTAMKRKETPSALSDSNCYPREENDTAVAESLELKQEESVLDVEIGPLREKVSELESRCQDLINENTALKQDVDRWKIREASLLEKSNQVNPEEMKRLETKVDDPKNEMQSTQETSKEQQLENKNLKELKALRLQIMTLRTANHILKKEKELPSNDNKKVADEMEKLRAQLQTTQLELANLKNSQVCRDMEQVSKEMDKAGKLLEEQKNTVMAVQSIASKYKNEKQYQDVQKEQEERGIARPGQPEGSANNVKIGDNDITEVREEENSERDAEIKKLHDEIAILKRDADLAKANCRMRNRIKNLRKELSSTKAQNTEAEGQKNELQMKCSKLEESVEERDVRFAAMKSQYEDHLIHLEEENKDLKATSLCPTPTEYLTVLQEKDELKKENVMIKQRMEALENQTSIVVNPEKVLPIENSKTNIGVIAGPSPNRKKRSDCDNVLKRLEKKQKMKQKRYNIFMARKGTHPKYNEAPKSDQKMMTAYSSIRLNVGAGTKRRKNSETKTPKSTPPSTLRNDELPPKLRHMVIPASLPAQFLLLAQANTERNVETGGFLVGKIRGDQLFITHLIIPKQTGTSDSFVTTNEFETFGLNLSQFKNDLLTMGWIHTHPSQTAFLSSVDMHNHFLQQSSLPESIAIVCSVKDYETGYFGLTQKGLEEIGNCKTTGFHPHDEGLYARVQHFTLDATLPVKVHDLRG